MQTSLNAIILAANSLVPAGTSLKDSVANIRNYFDPPVGQMLQLEKSDLRDKAALGQSDLRGYIRVNPPRGKCFTVQTKESAPDETVCKSTSIPFTFNDLDEQGKVTWNVVTNKTDFGTTVSWPTPYRIGRAVDLNMPWPGASNSVFILKCEAVAHKESGRRIYLSILGGKEWVISLPAKDTLVPQPRPNPNLFISDSKKSAFIKVKKKKDGEEEPSSEAEGEEGEAEEPDYDPDVAKEDAKWQTHSRNAFFLDGHGFMSTESTPPGTHGRCRYKYSYERDKDTGLIECLNVDRYKWLYLPLTCLSRLKPAE